ncbi:hypothetical protein BOTBODRAFT_90220, partial [Botryobasidium botryosum FD-172 SS1]
TGMSVRTIKRVLHLYRSIGQPYQDFDHRQLCGRNRLLDDESIIYLRQVIAQTPDVYLDELRESLYETYGKHVSDSTIWRALKKAGFTMKKV